jgi:signal transduction histidine kinase
LTARPAASRILVVDDDREMLDFLSDQLGSRGFQVTTAQSGGHAIELVRRDRFDLVICDLKMPLMDGIACMESISQSHPTVQVIMISGEATIDNAVNAVKRGAYDFLQKPVQMERLLYLIEKASLKEKLETMTQAYYKSRSILSQLDLGEMLDPAMRYATPFFHASHGCWTVLENGRPKIVSSFGLDTGFTNTALAVAAAAFREARRDRRSHLVTGGLANHALFREAPGAAAIHSSIVIPLYVENEPDSVFILNRTTGGPDFDSSEMREAAHFAERLCQTIETSRLHLSLDRKMSELRQTYSDLEASKTLLHQKEKLAQLGTLIAGVAHEINNPLSIVMGYADLLLSSDETPVASKEHLELILGEAERCRNMVQEMLTYAQARKPQFRWLEAHKWVEDCLKLLALDFAQHHVYVCVEAPDEPLGFAGDPDQLKQVLLNLLRNAAQAMAGQKDKHVWIELGATGEKISVRVHDNGPGIAPENLSRIFQAYFTTKKNGEGTGLGLSLTADIIQAHHGKISVESRPHEGTLFLIEIPRTQPDLDDSLGHAA